MVVGRKSEIAVLNEKYASAKSEFVAIYGRRRVGKTFLVRSTFEEKFTFQLTGLANANLAQQLSNFNLAMKDQCPNAKRKNATNWMEAFHQIEQVIEKSKKRKLFLLMSYLGLIKHTLVLFLHLSIFGIAGPRQEKMYYCWCAAPLLHG
jgi:uncharacterized protein